MLLRVSDSTAGLDVVTSGKSDEANAIPNEQALVSFTEALLSDTDMGPTRDALRNEIGEAGVVDAAAVVAQFDAITRVADGAGISLDSGMVNATTDMRAELGIDAFDTHAV